MAGEDVQVLIQGHRRQGMRTAAALVAVLRGELVVAVPSGDRQAWPVSVSSVTASPGRLAGMTSTITVPDETLVVSRAITVDESERLVHVLEESPQQADEFVTAVNYWARNS